MCIAFEMNFRFHFIYIPTHIEWNFRALFMCRSIKMGFCCLVSFSFFSFVWWIKALHIMSKRLNLFSFSQIDMFLASFFPYCVRLQPVCVSSIYYFILLIYFFRSLQGDGIFCSFFCNYRLFPGTYSTLNTHARPWPCSLFVFIYLLRVVCDW